MTVLPGDQVAADLTRVFAEHRERHPQQIKPERIADRKIAFKKPKVKKPKDRKPRKPLTPQQKANISAGMAAAKARREAG